MVAVSMMAVAAVRVGASHQFGDVQTGNAYHGDVDWLVDRGITGGCGSGLFCPKSTVTRETMAAFLHRTANVSAPTTWFSEQAGIGALNLDNDSARPHVCVGSSTFMADYEQVVYVNGRVSLASTADSPTVAVFAWVSYTVDGGSTWTRMEPDTPPHVQATAAGSEFTIPVFGTLDLEPDTEYNFSIELWDADEGTAGDATNDIAAGGRCGMYAMIFNRNV